MPERYKSVKFGSLDEYITPGKFRTIGDEVRRVPLGITEFLVEIHMKFELKSKLSFKAPWDGVIYGCARSKKTLYEKLNLKSDIKKGYLIDWDNKYLFLLELENQQEYPVAYVPNGDVLTLLEKCMRTPEQR